MGVIKKYELGRVEVAFIVIVLIAALLAGIYAWKTGRDKEAGINSFAECVAAGNPVMESYPEQCAANGKTWANPNQAAPQTSNDTVADGLVTFYNASQISTEKRAEIKQKVTDPLVYYETQVLKSPDFKGVSIDLGLAEDNVTRSTEHGYTLSYNYDNPELDGTGFVFGDNGTISYWIPQLCDPGGCNPYPEDFKAAFPETYKAYEQSQSGNKPE